MPHFDMPLEALKNYLPSRDEASDFDSFWDMTLADARSYPINARFEPVNYHFDSIDTFDGGVTEKISTGISDELTEKISGQDDVVYEDLSTAYPLFNLLEHWHGGLSFNKIDTEQRPPFSVNDVDGIDFVPVIIESNAPPYSRYRDKVVDGNNIGLKIIDKLSGKYLFYLPGIVESTPQVEEILSEASCVLIDGTLWLDDEMIARLKEGVLLEDGMAKFTDIHDSGGTGLNHWFHVVLMEGRNREVRRLWASQGVSVSRLKRVRFGCMFMPSRLKVGKFEELGQKDADNLCAMVGLKSKPVIKKKPKDLEKLERQSKKKAKPVVENRKAEGKRNAKSKSAPAGRRKSR